MLLPSAYLPPISYLAACACTDEVILDSKEHFIKQTIRNRCHILSPNGIQQLIIPVVHNDRTHQPMEAIQISYDHPWQRQHWRSLLAAYRRSAYFEFYMDDFEPFYLERYDSLLEFNSALLQLLLKCCAPDVMVTTANQYHPYEADDVTDFRLLFNSGAPVQTTSGYKYPQVFSSKFGFTGGLSIIDLLFSLGPATGDFLKGICRSGRH